MALLESLQSHEGGLIRLKTELYWYRGRGWDGNPGRICLILDATTAAPATAETATADAAIAIAIAAAVKVLLLVDGSPQWIWVAEADVEVIDDPS